MFYHYKYDRYRPWIYCLFNSSPTYPVCDEDICTLEIKIKIVHDLYILSNFIILFAVYSKLNNSL